VAERPTKSARGHRSRPRKPPESAASSRKLAANSSRLAYAPRELGADGRRAWQNALRSAPWIDGSADLDLLRRFANLHDDRSALAEVIASEGRLTPGSTGQQVARPEVAMLASVDERLLKLAAALGLGPAARRRLTGRLEVERKRPQLAQVVDLYAEAEAS
jgi:P27 family predicted phage terminase small subunit